MKTALAGIRSKFEAKNPSPRVEVETSMSRQLIPS
jgi:hypothetical protein